MGIIIWIITGAVIGTIVSLFLSPENWRGVLADLGVGTIGAVVAGWGTSIYTNVNINTFDMYSFGISVLGAIVLLAVYEAMNHSPVSTS